MLHFFTSKYCVKYLIKETVCCFAFVSMICGGVVIKGYCAELPMRRSQVQIPSEERFSNNLHIPPGFTNTGKRSSHQA